jgi:hypothetical protein
VILLRLAAAFALVYVLLRDDTDAFRKTFTLLAAALLFLTFPYRPFRRPAANLALRLAVALLPLALKWTLLDRP